MRHVLPILSGLSLAALVAASPAVALDAYVTTDLNMRAGPGTNYPVVASVPDDALVDIQGCVAGYAWCDVIWRGRRGWVSGRYLAFLEGRRYVEVEDLAPSYGLPIIGFDVGTYWGRWYRDEPWYEQRFRWGGRPYREDWRERRGGTFQPHYDGGRLPQPGDAPAYRPRSGGAIAPPPIPGGGEYRRQGGASGPRYEGGRLPQPGDGGGLSGGGAIAPPPIPGRGP